MNLGSISVRGSIIDGLLLWKRIPLQRSSSLMKRWKAFVPLTQPLNCQRGKIGFVTIVPNVNTEFDKKDKVSLLQVLPENTVIWVENMQLVFG